MTKTKFISPYEDKAPAGAEGWQDLYPYYMLFHENLKQQEEEKFFFCDSQHWHSVFKPFDAITTEFFVRCLGAYNTRQWLIPPANGVDFKIHNGYCYMSPVGVDPSLIADRVPQFMERAGFYFQNWNDLIAQWHEKVAKVTADMEAITFEALPDVIDMSWVTEGKGIDPHLHMTQNYNRLIELCYETCMLHFEFLNLGYAAYLDFFGFCKESFPGIPDLAIAKMVQGIESDLFRPDEEIRKLAKLAVASGIADVMLGSTLDEALATLTTTEAGQAWIAAWDAAKDPWFNFTSGNGMYSSDKYWRDYPEIPFGYLQNYIERIQKGENIDRPTEEISKERVRITEEYRDSLLSEEAQAIFDGKLGLSRVVFPYVENHNFYIEHWAFGVFWRKMRELSAVFKEAGFWSEIEDIFYFRREEIWQILFDYGNAWAIGVPFIGPNYLPQEIERRKKILDALSTAPPQPAYNKPPEVITEPFTIMLWGITTESVQSWLNGSDDTSKLKGMAASPGLVEGRARVLFNPDDLALLEEGEILVTRVTAPSWAPVFGKIRAAVTDIGGMMSHAAIVCREYGLPAVTGTGSASTSIKTGDMIRVNGSTGEVEIIG